MRARYEQYSAFEHMLDALFLRDEDLMAIIAPDPFTLYCDVDAAKMLRGSGVSTRRRAHA